MVLAEGEVVPKLVQPTQSPGNWQEGVVLEVKDSALFPKCVCVCRCVCVCVGVWGYDIANSYYLNPNRLQPDSTICTQHGSLEPRPSLARFYLAAVEKNHRVLR